MAGGLKVNDPACDMAVVCAILSSNFDVAIPQSYCFAAEVGLSGEIRPVGQIERRISEAEKLGFEKIFISSFNKPSGLKNTKIKIVAVEDIPALVKALFK